MNKLDCFGWIIYSGISGAIALSLLAAVMIVWAKHFIPQPVHLTWRESPILLLLTLPGGFMLGGWIGYELAPKTHLERINFLQENLFCAVIVGVGHLVLSKLVHKPDFKNHFWGAIAYDLGPIFLAAGLLKLLKN